MAILSPLSAAILSSWHQVHDMAPCWMLPSRGTWGPLCWEDPSGWWFWRARGLPPPPVAVRQRMERLAALVVCGLGPSQGCRDLGLGAALHPPFPEGGDGMWPPVPILQGQLPCATSTIAVKWLQLVGNKIRLFSIILGIWGGLKLQPAPTPCL